MTILTTLGVQLVYLESHVQGSGQPMKTSLVIGYNLFVIDYQNIYWGAMLGILKNLFPHQLCRTLGQEFK